LSDNFCRAAAMIPIMPISKPQAAAAVSAAAKRPLQTLVGRLIVVPRVPGNGNDVLLRGGKKGSFRLRGANAKVEKFLDAFVAKGRKATAHVRVKGEIVGGKGGLRFLASSIEVGAIAKSPREDRPKR
jgi:hypothetical protein